jgi:hypothetical protein
MTLLDRLEAIRTKFFDTQTTILLKRHRGDTGGDMAAIADLERHRAALQEASLTITALTAALAEAWCAVPADICVDYGYDEYGKRHVTVWCFYPSHDIRTSLQTLPRV